MNRDMLTRLYRLLLRLYPQDHRQDFGEEMVGVFEQSVEEARQDGNRAVMILLLRELLYLPAGLAQAYAQSWRQWQPALVTAPNWPWALGWAAATTAAFPLAFFLMTPLAGGLLLLLRLLGADTIADPNALRALGFLLALASCVAGVQYVLLRPHFSGAGWWFGVTVSGWLAAGSLLAIIYLLTAWLGLDSTQWMPTILPLSLGLMLGLFQMPVVRRLTSRASWWLPINILAFSSLLLAGRAFESFLELGVIFSLPGTIGAAGLWWLLRQMPQGRKEKEAAALSKKRPWITRPAVLAFLAVSLLALGLLAPWAYAVAQLELAKSEGVYASAEEAIIARHNEGWGGASVVSVENVHAGPNRRDGMDHVWFGGARVTYDRVPDGGRRQSYVTGSYYLRVRDGWVHVPEGAFPELVGWLMELYNLEGQ